MLSSLPTVRGALIGHLERARSAKGESSVGGQPSPEANSRSRLLAEQLPSVATASARGRALVTSQVIPHPSRRKASLDDGRNARNHCLVGAGQHPHTLVVIIGGATKGRGGQIGKVPLSHIAAAGLANHQSERQKLRCRRTDPCLMLSVRSVSALSLGSALRDDARQCEQELLWFYQVGRRWRVRETRSRVHWITIAAGPLCYWSLLARLWRSMSPSSGNMRTGERRKPKLAAATDP